MTMNTSEKRKRGRLDIKHFEVFCSTNNVFGQTNWLEFSRLVTLLRLSISEESLNGSLKSSTCVHDAKGNRVENCVFKKSASDVRENAIYIQCASLSTINCEYARIASHSCVKGIWIQWSYSANIGLEGCARVMCFKTHTLSVALKKSSAIWFNHAFRDFFPENVHHFIAISQSFTAALAVFFLNQFKAREKCDKVRFV